MTTTPLHPLVRAPRLVAVVNPLVSRLMRAGLRLGPNVLLTVRGRTSGLDRTFPVALLEHRGGMFVQSPYGEVNWVRNLRADGRATLARGASRVEVEAVELGPEAAEPILRATLAPYQAHRLTAAFARRFIPLGPGDSREVYIEHVRRHAVFELRPLAPAQGSAG